MKYLILLMLVLYSSAWAIIAASPQAAREAAAIQGDQKTHDVLIIQQRHRVREYQKRLYQAMQRLVKAKAKLWQLENGLQQQVLPLTPGPVMPHNSHATSPHVL